MRLFTHLFVSHVIPVLVVALAMSLALVALVRISLVLTELNDAHLTSLRYEGDMHRAAWAVDVSLRHGQAECVSGEISPAAAHAIDEAVKGLRAELVASRELDLRSPSAMRPLAKNYVHIVEDILGGDLCAGILGVEASQRRAQLDEDITTVWVNRLQELHQIVGERDSAARDIAIGATWSGIPLAALSILMAMLVARRMTRMVTHPLAALASVAGRVGQGDFTSVAAPQVEGPEEIVSLAAELERMRTRLAELEHLKQGFLASVSHELRTPLSKIREALALMQDGAVGEFTDKQSRIIRIARTACEREIRLVTTLLDLSRLRAGGPMSKRSGVSIDSVLQLAMQDELVDAQARDVRIELQTDGEAPPSLLDPLLMERAVANVIRNAVAVSDPASSVVVLRGAVHKRRDAAGSWLSVVVRDQGPGVPKDIRDSIFDPFVTHAISRSSKTLGTGLGLALAKEVAQAHGGDLTLLETGPQGSAFELLLPVEAPKNSSRGQHSQSTTEVA